MRDRRSIVLLMLVFIALLSLPAAVQANECEPGFRLFDHELLATEPVCVPENPQRIAAVDRFTYETLLVLGIEPIAGTDFALGIKDNLPYLSPQVEAAVSIGDTTAINFERLLELSPDLIFTLESYGTTAELSLIAPTVSFTLGGSSRWREIAAATALAVNAEETLAEVVADYEQRLESLQTILNVPDTFEIAVVRPGDDGLLLPMQNLFLHTILDNAGLSLPTAWAEFRGDTAYATISIERLNVVDADVMLIWWFTGDPQADEALGAYISELERNPLWQTLEVVRSGNVHVVGSYWIGSSYHAAHAVIDDLFTYVAGVDPAEVSPNPFLTASEQVTATFPPVPGFPAFTPTPPLIEIVEDRGDTLLVRHRMGETEIPANPQRIYTDASTTQIALSLGLPVVGAQYFTNLLNIPDLAPLLEGVTELGTNTYQANFEAILAQQPDLIIVWANVATNPEAQSVYDTLSQIAPTIVLNGNPFTYWQQATRVLGRAFGREAEAQALLSNYAERSAALCERIRAVIGDGTVTIFDVFGGAIRVIGAAAATPDGSVIPPAFTSWAYVDCRLTPGEEVARLTGGSHSASVTLESLGELQADHLIVYTNVASPDAEQVYQTFTESPLWALLPAVQNDQVYRVDVLDASGYFSALYVLEQVAEAVSGD